MFPVYGGRFPIAGEVGGTPLAHSSQHPIRHWVNRVLLMASWTPLVGANGQIRTDDLPITS
jgi:hypothetical protein